MLIGMLIWIAILCWISYNLYKMFSPSHREQRRKNKIEKQLLKEKLSHEEASCYACGKKYTKNKMKLYNIIVNEEYLGTHTEYISWGLGGSKQVTTKRIYYVPGYICRTCEMNWEIACVIWILVMIVGELLTYLFYHYIFSSNVNTAMHCFMVGTAVSYFCARYCWKMYRLHKHCHIKTLNN